jgi:phasin family protein
MQNQAFENMEKVGEFSLETAKRLGGLNTRLWDRLSEQQLAGVALWVDAAIKQLRLLGETQNPYDIYAGQAQLAQEYAERVSEYVRQTMAVVMDVQNELGGVFRPGTKATGAVIASSVTPYEAVPPAADKPKTADRLKQ